MKIALITTLSGLIENKRIESEVVALGHDFKLVSLRDFSFEVRKGELAIEELTGLKADVIIIRGIFNAMKSVAAAVSNLREHGTAVFDNNFLVSRYSIDKVADLLKLSLAGVAVPDTVYSREFDKYINKASGLGYPVIVKSARMGKGAGVYKCKDEQELARLIDELKNAGREAKGYLMQEFVPYEYDLRILVIGEKIFTMRRIPAEGEFRANFSLGGAVEPYELDDSGRELALKALSATGMSVGGVDMLITNTGRRAILEVNHTAGMVGMEKALGENITKVYVEHALKNAMTTEKL